MPCFGGAFCFWLPLGSEQAPAPKPASCVLLGIVAAVVACWLSEAYGAAIAGLAYAAAARRKRKSSSSSK